MLYTEHSNYVAIVDKVGPIVLSIQKDKQFSVLRALVRIPERTYHICVNNRGSGFFGLGSKKENNLKTVLEKTELDVPVKAFKKVKGITSSKEILNFDDSHVSQTNKDCISANLSYSW